MCCKEFQQEMSRQLDGDLTAAGQERLSRHLAVCAPCRRDWELLALGKQLCETSRRDVLPPADFTARVLRSMRTETVQRSALWVQLCAAAERMLPAFAMLVILFLGIFFALRQAPDTGLAVQDNRELFIPTEDRGLLISDQRDITPDLVIKTVLEGK